MTNESFSALENLCRVFYGFDIDRRKVSKFYPTFDQHAISGKCRDAMERAYLDSVNDKWADELDAGALKFVETWLEYDGEKNLVEAAT